MVTKRVMIMLLMLSLAMLACQDLSTPESADRGGLSSTDEISPTQQAWTRESLSVESLRAESTLEAAQLNAEQWHASQTAIAAEATRQVEQITRESYATETERAWLVAGWTATADVAISTATASTQQTAAAIMGTQTRAVEERDGTGTMAAVSAQSTLIAVQAMSQSTQDAFALQAQATVVAAQAYQAALAAERQRMVNVMVAWLRYVLILGSAILAGYLLWRVWRAKSLQAAVVRDHTGDPVWYPDERRGSVRILQPGRSLGPALLSAADGVSEPTLSDLDHQLTVTQRAQLIEALKALRASDGSRQQRKVLQQIAQRPQLSAGLQVVPSEQVNGWLREVMPKIYQDAIEVEANNELITGRNESDELRPARRSAPG
jgi:hypothetical protein